MLLIFVIIGLLGLVDSAEVGSVTIEEEKTLALYLGHTSRVLPKRAESLGWSPKEASLDEAMEGDLEVILRSL